MADLFAHHPKKKNYGQKVGKMGEDMAVAYCRNIGYTIIARHFTSRFGEIDIIATDKKETVFIEVKTRRSRMYGIPEESVTDPKINRIINTVEVFISDHPEVMDYRIDVIIIQFHSDGSDHLLRHIKRVGVLDEMNSKIDNYSI